VEFATLERVDWFNNRRLLAPISNIPPAEAEENFHANLETEAMAAKPMSTSLGQTRRRSISRPAAPPLSPSGVNPAQPNTRRVWANKDWFVFV
jgi:hypothetical protein